MATVIADTLSRHFKGVAVKKLTAVEAHPERSNQHEFNGVAALKQLFGLEGPKRFPAQFVWLSDDDYDLASADGFVTWYDARQNHPTRTEHRLYFPTTSVTEKASENDTVLIARLTDDTVLVVIAADGSSAESELLWLFRIHRAKDQFTFREISSDHDQTLGAAAAFLLDQIGITPENRDNDLLAEMLTRFERGFPTTREFSEFARRTAGTVDVVRNPDNSLMAFIEHEEKLFLIFERFLVTERLEKGFMRGAEPDVDTFVRFSLSVHNRRKSRAGRALENHMEYVLRHNGISFSPNPVTENRSRPDFLFPGIAEYRNANFPPDRLTVLAAKSTCKERWRQILAEARRIPVKHLLTLEPKISGYQMDEMADHNVQLVVPTPLQLGYAEAQRAAIMSVERFIALTKSRQETSPHDPAPSRSV